MTARLILNERHVLAGNVFVEIVIWQLDKPLFKSSHSYKYRLALVVDNQCVIRFDNESGKGDHKHLGDKEMTYCFISPQVLLEDFWKEVDERRM